jgi:hypothetical protein
MIRDLLFGKKKFIKIDKLGTFAARFKANSVKIKSWLSTIRIEGYSDEIVIILEGDSSGPFTKQIESVTLIIENIEQFDDKLRNKIQDNSRLNEKFKKINLKELRLACINPWDETRKNFELSYELISDETVGLSVIYQNHEIIEIE